MNPMWKVYKSKVMKTINPEYEDDAAEEATEIEHDMTPMQDDEGPNAVSQLAKKMQGAGTKSWNRFSSLFNKEDEHQLLEETESPPVADHPLAVKPEEPPRPTKRTAFWDSFAANWAAKKQAEAAAAANAAEQGEAGVMAAGGEQQQDEQITTGEESEGGSSSKNSFSKYMSLGGGAGGGAGGEEGSEEASFKWNFVTSKLAELKTKSMTKTN